MQTLHAASMDWKSLKILLVHLQQLIHMDISQVQLHPHFQISSLEKYF